MTRRNSAIFRRIIGQAALAAALCLLSVGAARGSGVIPTNQWVNLYSANSRLDCQPVPEGATIAAYDAQGVLCAEVSVEPGREGQYGIMPCYADDSSTGDDEGASPGDVLSFRINDRTATPRAVTLNATPVPPDTVVTWTQSLDRWEVDLEVPPANRSRQDIDGNCRIDVADIMAVAGRWNCARGDACYWEVADIDGDGDTDIVDIMSVAGRWGCVCCDDCYD